MRRGESARDYLLTQRGLVFFETTVASIVTHFTNTCLQLLLGVPKNKFAWPLFAYLLLLK